MNEDCSNKYHLHDRINVKHNQVNSNNIKNDNLNETYQMNNVTEINRALPHKIEFSPESNHHHRYSFLQNNEPIDKFIDELIEGIKQSCFHQSYP